MGAWDWIPGLIASEGRVVTLTRQTGTSDPSKPHRGNLNVAADSITPSAVMVRFRASEIDNSNVLKTDQIALVSGIGQSAAIDTYDTLTDTNGDGREWKILKVDKVEPGGENLLYKLHLRR